MYVWDFTANLLDQSGLNWYEVSKYLSERY